MTTRNGQVIFKKAVLKKPSKMMNSVEQDEFDIQQGLQSVWAITFGVLYLLVMSISIILYLLTVRAVAKNGRRENVTYFLVFFLFFTALVEYALIIEGRLAEK